MAKSRRRCEVCGQVLELARTGRPKRFCSDRCRQIAHRKLPRQLAFVDVFG